METETLLHPASCRPDGCAGLCTDAGLRAADAAYRRMLIARARRVLGDPALAEEAAQEALIRAWRSCATFDPAGGPLRAWLLTIVHRVAVDLARARARRPQTTPHHPDFEPADRLSATHEDTVVLRDQLLGALAGIGPAHRHVVVETFLR